MKILIIFLIVFSCSIRENVDFVESKPVQQVQQKLDKMEAVDFNTVDAFSSDIETVVQLVVMKRRNSYGILKVWYTHNVFKNAGLLADGSASTVVVTVQTLKAGEYIFDKQYINVAKADSSDVDKVSLELKTIAQQKFYKLIMLLVDNEV